MPSGLSPRRCARGEPWRSAGGRQSFPISRYVEIGLVEPERLDEVGEFDEDRMDLLRDRSVHIEARRHEHKIGAAPHRGDRRQRGLHAEGPRLIAGGSAGSRKRMA